ncbi:MAG: GNAT family N-acetyltransferase [Dokdonella sp.]
MQRAIDHSNLSLRDATVDDIEAVVALVESGYRGDLSRKGWTTEADMLDGQRIDPAGVLEVIVKPESRVLLVECDGKLSACCHLERQDESAYFGMFTVSPLQQGSGLGGYLLAAAERIARDEWNCVELRMTVISIRNELVTWYERRGYRRSGQFKPFPYGDERFGIPKRDDLRFEFLTKSLAREDTAFAADVGSPDR